MTEERKTIAVRGLFEPKTPYCEDLRSRLFEHTPRNDYCAVVNTVQVPSAFPRIPVPIIPVPQIDVPCPCLQVKLDDDDLRTQGPPGMQFEVKNRDKDCCDPLIYLRPFGFCHRPVVSSIPLDLNITAPHDSGDGSGAVVLSLAPDDQCSWGLKLESKLDLNFKCPVIVDDTPQKIPISVVDPSDTQDQELSIALEGDETCTPRIRVEGGIKIPKIPKYSFEGDTCVFDFGNLGSASLAVQPDSEPDEDGRVKLQMECNASVIPQPVVCTPSIDVGCITVKVGDEEYESCPDQQDDETEETETVVDEITGEEKEITKKTCNFNITWPDIKLPCIPKIQAGGSVAIGDYGSVDLNVEDNTGPDGDCTVKLTLSGDVDIPEIPELEDMQITSTTTGGGGDPDDECVVEKAKTTIYYFRGKEFMRVSTPEVRRQGSVDTSIYFDAESQCLRQRNTHYKCDGTLDGSLADEKNQPKTLFCLGGSPGDESVRVVTDIRPAEDGIGVEFDYGNLSLDYADSADGPTIKLKLTDEGTDKSVVYPVVDCDSGGEGEGG